MHCIVPMYLYVFLSIIAMAGLNYYKPKFNWDAIDKLSELDHFKAECEVLFNGPLDESPPNKQAGLVVNWLGSEAGLALRSLNLTYDEPNTIFDALREAFRPIGNRMMYRFKFKSVKQKQGATVDAYMAELKVLIKECGYEENMRNILLKDQFIFGVTVREIQEHLLNEIGDNRDLNQCFIEACKIELHIAQRKLLGLKSIQYDSIGNQRSRPQKRKFKPKDKRPQSRSQSGIRDCKYCGTNHQCQQCPAYGKTCKSCGKKNHFAKKCHSRSQSQSGSTGSKKSFKYREVNVDQESSDDGQIDEITSKVRSTYYNDIHFNSVNTHMHIKLNTKSCNGNSLKTCFKLDTDADGNLLPLEEFFKHSPNANMTQLAKTIDVGTKLYAYNNTEIEQLGACELLVEYREHCKICQFYVVDFPTAILGIHDSESLGLITIYFDCIGAETSQTSTKTDMYVNAIQSDADSDDFSIRIKCEYKDLFTVIGNMNTVIDIKLKEGTIPYVAPIHHVAHALQEPLGLELEKLVDESILCKLKIEEKSEWLNWFVCVRKPNGRIRLCLDLTHLNKYIV